MKKKPSTLLEFRSTCTGKYGERLRCLPCYTNSINRFGAFLGHVATFADLTPENDAAFAAWLGERYADKSARDTRYRLRGMWRAADRQGLTTIRAPQQHYREAKRYAWETDAPAEQSLRWFYEESYYPLRIRGRSPRTHVLYGHTVRAFGAFLGREAMLADLSDRVLSDYMASILERGLSPHSAVKEFDQLVAIWRGACRRGLLKEWPGLPRPQAPERIPKAWTRSELDRLFAGLADATGKIAGVAAADWWTALHHVLWYTGERISGILHLRWSDVDLENGWLVVPAAARKGRKRDKATRLPTIAVDALKRIEKPSRDLIFPWDTSPTYIYKIYTRLLRRVGLSTDCKSKFHRMRKSAASHFEAAGGNATSLLDHSSRTVTLAYLDPRIVTPTQGADLLFEVGTKG
jgi:integrase